MIKLPYDHQCLLALFLVQRRQSLHLCLYGSKLEADLSASLLILAKIFFCTFTQFQGQDLIADQGMVGGWEVWCNIAHKTLVQQAEKRQKSDLVVQKYSDVN